MVGLTTIAADERPTGENNVTMLDQPLAPPLLWCRVVRRTRGPTDHGREWPGPLIFGQQQQMILVEVCFDGQIQLDASIRIEFAPVTDDCLLNVAEPASVPIVRLELAEEARPESYHLRTLDLVPVAGRMQSVDKRRNQFRFSSRLWCRAVLRSHFVLMQASGVVLSARPCQDRGEWSEQKQAEQRSVHKSTSLYTQTHTRVVQTRLHVLLFKL